MPIKTPEWDTRREGRRWADDEFDQRISVPPEKIGYVDGIFASERQRLIVLGTILENLGIEGDPVRQARRQESRHRRPGGAAGFREPALMFPA